MSMVDIPNNVSPPPPNPADATQRVDETPLAPAAAPAAAMEVSPARINDISLDPPQSQPMTATTSSASQNLGQDEGDGSGAAPYGTRSRNRTAGKDRPNYSDDRDLDHEIEVSGRYQKSQAKKNTAPTIADATAVMQPDAAPAVVQNGFAAVNTNATVLVGPPATARDTIPGTSTFSTQPAPPVTSKKRKQPGSNTTVTTPATTQASTKARGGGSAASRLHLETNMMTFSRRKARLNAKKELIADDGTALAANDHAYLVCEPPGEPYYLARIMEFLPATSEADSPIDAVRVNWYYRPKDIQRRVQDTRVVFASMHSDTCPLTSLRGKCNIQHLSNIPDLDKYRVQKDCFWFDKLYDRYMHRYYEVVPTSKIINVPQHVKKVLDERWKFVLIEIGRGKELTSAVKTCKKCSLYAASQDSVDCAVCRNTYHMACIRPPLLRKPARGFAWACAACSRAQELRLEARHTPILTEGAPGEDDVPEEEDDAALRDEATRESSLAPEAHQPPTAQQLAQANLWPYRYLGIHARVEDALDYDDRIYPRASSRLGPRHQAQINVWHGRPVELVKPAEIKRKYIKTAAHKKDGKPAKDTPTQFEVDKESKLKRPKWVIDEPFGYIARGEDFQIEIKGKKEFTAQLTFKMPDSDQLPSRGDDDVAIPDDRENVVDEYMRKVKLLAPQYNIQAESVDFLTKAIEKLQESSYNIEKALSAMKSLHIRSDLKQPDLNREEVKRFEEGVAKYGSELQSVARHVGPTFKVSRIVRYYYMWKKTDRGRQVWGNYEGRKSKKESKRLEKDGTTTKLLDDVADDADDSAFDNDKAVEKKRGFECKFCSTHASRQWRRAPGTAPNTLVPGDTSAKNSKDKSNWLTLALCGKCAYLWRRYAIQYESIEEVSKKIAAAGGRASKRRIDEELMRTIVEAQHESGDTISVSTAEAAKSAGVDVPATIIQEVPKKKIKSDKDTQMSTPEAMPEKKKDKVPEAPLVPEEPRARVHPCAICLVIEHPGDDLLKCRDCRLHVHKSCYGVGMAVNSKTWFCDMCRNDHTTQVSTTYECVLCPVKYTRQELFEPPKVTHKKKTDREREKERLEKDMINQAARQWQQLQEAAGRPVIPREALKPTAWNNWVHVICALWTKEIKFGNAELLDGAEGVGFIPRERLLAVCKICKASGMPTVSCHAQGCNTEFHVGCAHSAGYIFGFDMSVVKGTRRDALNAIKLDQETGVPTAAIWCPHHPITSYVHHMLEPTEEGITALQLFARTYKQADNSITGTVRRAAQFVRQSDLTVAPGHRRSSAINGIQATPNARADKTSGRSNRSPSVASSRSADETQNEAEEVTPSNRQGDISKCTKKCCNCAVKFSPKWWTVPKPSRHVVSSTVANGTAPSADGLSEGKAESANRIPSAAPTNGILTASIHADPAQTNGVVKNEISPGVGNSNLTSDEGEAIFQCHKCHAAKLPPPTETQEVITRHPLQMQENPYASYVNSEPLFYQAPLGRSYPSYDAPRPQADALPGPAHSHPVVPPPPSHLQHVPWPPTAPSSHHSPLSHNSAWPPPVRNGGASMSNGMSSGPAYGHQTAPPSHPPYGDPYAARPSYSSPYANIPPPPHRYQSTSGPAQHHSSHIGNGPPPSQANYPPSPRQYGGPPISEHPVPASAQTYGGPPSNFYGPPDSHQSASALNSGPGSSRNQRMATGSPQMTPHNRPQRPYGHSRQPSTDTAMAPTPSTPKEIERPGSASQGQMPGASASPSLRNLLS